MKKSKTSLNPKISENGMTYYLDDFRDILPNLDNFQTVIVDPPYNINFDYKGGYKDNLDSEDYKNLIKDILNLSYKATKDEASFFIILPPLIIGELFETIKATEWRVHQWISWVYPSNVGHSKNKFTTAHRGVLWLTKDNPKIYIDRVSQPYKNPTDKRVKKLIESGKDGTNLYDWWDHVVDTEVWQEINLVKNTSADKALYVNQIPTKLLRKLILVTTNPKQKVLDPMCGTGSTLIAARREGRVGFGIDQNKDLVKLWKSNVKEAF